MRYLLLSAGLVPFLIYARRDSAMHRHSRTVPPLEQALHFCLTLAIVAIVGTAMRGAMTRMFIALGVFILLGLCDELIYHRDIPAEEHSVHAKQHLLMFAYVLFVLALDHFGIGV